MKHLTLILTLLFSTLMIASPAYADWEKVGDDMIGTNFYVDTDSTIEVAGHVYYWELRDYLEPSLSGYISAKIYYQGDCYLFKYRDLSHTVYKQQMGEGNGMSATAINNEWKNPPPNSTSEAILKQVCEYAETL